MTTPLPLLRRDLLRERTIALAGGAPPALAALLRDVGARVVAPWDGERVDALVYDAAPAFGAGGEEGLRAALDESWAAIHAAATGSLIAGGGGGGAIVLIAPRPDAGPYAGAARAALENTARTLSVEWARFAVTTTMIAPGPETSADEIATLVAYLVSRAGEYLSGCRFDLGEIGSGPVP